VSSPVGSSLLGARFAAFISPPEGLTEAPLFSFPVFLRGRPLLTAEDFGPPFICTGVLGLDEDNADLPVGAFSVLVLPVCGIGYEDERVNRQVQYVFFLSHADFFYR
jgi:hypothetical protein